MKDDAPLGYCFEGFSFLLNERVLLQNGTRIRLRPKPFNTLLLLLRNAPSAVTREQFAGCVWGKTAVEDSNLTVQIRSLRKTLGDSARESRYIETIPKAGYRFIPAVTPITSDGSRNGEHRQRGRRELLRHSGALAMSATVPAPLVRLIGREREVKELRGLLLQPGVRLVTLVGTGGSGKTELAQQTASGVAKSFPHGAVFVSLASISDPSLVGSAIAQSLGIRESASGSLDNTVAMSLRKRKVLLLLDNFEHLITAAEFVVWLLRMCPRVTALVTSRAPLRVGGERVYELAPLPLPNPKAKSTVRTLAECPSVALFVERATAVRSDFSLTDKNAAAVAEICRATGGLPLAIELAAAQAWLSLDEMLASSERWRLDLLTAGRRDAPDRQQTMTKNIEWSYQPLSAEEKTVFAQLSVFVGGFTRSAAGAVCAEPAGSGVMITEVLTSLLENRLVAVQRSTELGLEPRFEMLEVIREYAADRLAASAGLDVTRHRRAEFFCEFAESLEEGLQGPESGVLLSRVDAELGNIRAALSWCVGGASVELGLRLAGALRKFWFRRGLISEGAGWLSRLGVREAHASPRVIAKGLLTLGQLVVWRGQREEAGALLEEALAIYRGLGDTLGVAETARLLGKALVEGGDLAAAEAMLNQSLFSYQQGADSANVRSVLGCLAHLAYMAGENERALELDREGLRLARQGADANMVAHLLNNIGFLLILQGDRPGAIDCLRESIALAVDLGHSVHSCDTLESVAYFAYRERDFARAMRILGAAGEWREFHGVHRPTSVESDCNEILRAARVALKPEALAGILRQGAEMSLEEAAQYALCYLDSESPKLPRAVHNGRRVAG